MVLIPALIGSAALLGLAGRVYRRAIARALDRRFARNETGIIVGAEPISLQGSVDAAVLLVHGGGDTPQTMHRVAEMLNGRGYTTVAPLLPGHGRDLDAFHASDAEAWYEAVRTEFAALRKTHSWVGVVGLSMGGALSARLAAETGGVGALVLASPYLSMPPLEEAIARTAAVWGAFCPVVRTSSDLSVLDPDARAVGLGYGAFTHRTLRALRQTAARGRAALPQVKAPTLVIQSTTDNRIPTASTVAAFAQLGAREKKLEWIEGAGHVITVDYGWERVAVRSADWMDAHRVKKGTGRPADAPRVRR